MDIKQIKYALARQITADVDTLEIRTNYGNVYLEADLCRKVSKAIINVLESELADLEKQE